MISPFYLLVKSVAQPGTRFLGEIVFLKMGLENSTYIQQIVPPSDNGTMERVLVVTCTVLFDFNWCTGR